MRFLQHGIKDQRGPMLPLPHSNVAADIRGGILYLVNSTAVSFTAGNFGEAPAFGVVNFADTQRNVVVCRALQAQWVLATGATHNAG